MQLQNKHDLPTSNKVENLLITKLQMPCMESLIVARARLTQLIKESLKGQVTLLEAPAGFGKTTLLVEWVSNCLPKGWRTAWVSLDELDNEPERFWAYIFSACQQVYSKINFDFQPVLRADDPLSLTQLNPLINAVAQAPFRLCLMLDDCHCLENETVTRSLAYLINHQPRNLHLIFAGRTEAPVPVTRLLAKKQLVKITADDLAFTYSEAQLFFEKICGLEVAPGQVEALENATEGWIAGLQLTALSLKNQTALSAVPKLVSEKSAAFHFLIEEVLNRQTDAVRDFLLKTSILTEISVPLCNFVLDQDDSQALLEEIIRSNLFIVTLDAENHRYRYYALFAEALRACLQKTEPELVRDLHLRACRWLRENDSPEQALAHAIAAGDQTAAAEILEESAQAALVSLNLTRLKQWLQFFTPALLEKRPGLGIYYAVASYFSENIEQVEPILRTLEDKLNQQPAGDLSAEDDRRLRWKIAVLREQINCFQPRFSRSIERIEQLAQEAPEDDFLFPGLLSSTLVEHYTALGQTQKAITLHKRLCQTAIERGLLLQSGYWISKLALIYKKTGCLRLAEQTYQDLLEYAGRSELDFDFTLFAKSGLAEIALERNELDRATVLMKEVQQSIERQKIHGSLCMQNHLVVLRLARYFLVLNDVVRASTLVARVRACLLRKPAAVFQASSVLIDTQARIWRAADAAWPERFGEEDIQALNLQSIAAIAEKTAIVRLYLAQKKHQKALGLLSEIEAFIRNAKMNERLIELLELKSLALESLGALNDAFQTLDEALGLAQEEGYIRCFTDEGTAMKALLNAYAVWKKQDRSPQLHPTAAAFLNRVLASFADFPADNPALYVCPPAVTLTRFSSLQSERLSPKELEVVQRLIARETVKEIAAEMYISPNTVKTYIKRSYQKLNIHSLQELFGCAEEISNYAVSTGSYANRLELRPESNRRPIEHEFERNTALQPLFESVDYSRGIK
jgi:LuxR family maltose regulon positive regulatory protein